MDLCADGGYTNTVGDPVQPCDTFAESDTPDDGSPLEADELLIEEALGEDWSLSIDTETGQVEDGYLTADITMPNSSRRLGKRIRIPHLRHYAPILARYRVRIVPVSVPATGGVN